MIGSLVSRRIQSIGYGCGKLLPASKSKSSAQLLNGLKFKHVGQTPGYSTLTRSSSSAKPYSIRLPESCSAINIQCNTYSTEPEVPQKTSALTIVKDLKHLGSAPTASLVLGLGGLVPFMSAPAYMLIAGYYSPFIAFGQVAYGATILAFLGGIRWGITVPDESGIDPNWFNIGYSVTPSLIAWVGLLFPVPIALVTLMVGLGGTLYMDLTLPGYPPWLRALRFVLTSFAVLALWTTLVLRFTLDTQEVKKVKAYKRLKEEEIKAEPKVSVFQKTKSLLDEIPIGKKQENTIEKLPGSVNVKKLDSKIDKEVLKEKAEPLKVIEEEVKEIKG